MTTNGGCIHIDGCTCYARLQAKVNEVLREKEAVEEQLRGCKALERLLVAPTYDVAAHDEARAAITPEEASEKEEKR